MPITQLQEFFRTLTLDAHDTLVAQRLLSEIKNRLTFLSDVGLGLLDAEPIEQLAFGR